MGAPPLQGVGLDCAGGGTLVDRYRLYSDITKEHHYTTDLNEYQTLGTWGWAQEGVAHQVYLDDTPVHGQVPVPLYRLYHGGIRQHLWTTDANEYAVLGTWGWIQEGVDGYVLGAGVPGVTTPLYRMAYAFLPIHLWTTDLNEYHVLATRGWKQEGIAAHVITGDCGAIVYYVSTDGSDSNDGLSPDTPWGSLLYAEANATEPGSIIALKRGDIFVMTSALGIHHGGVSGDPIVWDGGLWGDGPNAVIRAGNDRGAGQLSIVNISGASHVTFQNITVDGNDKNAFGLVVGGTDSYYSPGAYQDSETSIIIQDSEFINCGTAANDYIIGVLFQTWNNDMSDIVFRRNRVDRASNHTVAAYCGRAEHGATPSKLRGITIAYNEVSNFGLNGQDRASGIAITQGVLDSIVEHNVVRQGDDGTAPALAIGGQPDEVPKNLVVRYNDIRMRDRPTLTVQNGYDPSLTVYGNLLYTEDARGRATVWMYIDPNGYDGADFRYFHNTIVAGQGTAFMDDTTTPGVTTFRNNILVNLELGGIDNFCYVANAADSVSHSNNIYYRVSGQGDIVSENDIGRISVGQLPLWEPTGRTDDPLLVDLPGFDWHLRAGSPAIGMGDPSVGIATDRDGVAFASPPSVGAYAHP
jgi:hypothetical protein